MENSLIDRLRGLPGLEVLDTREAEHDFGRLSRGRTLARVRPLAVAGLATLVKFARAEGVSLTPRCLGLSQSGQSIAVDGVSVDLRAFDGIEVLPDLGVARCGSAATWRQLLLAASVHGLTPEVVPLNLDLSIGGTLSAGGIGSTSHRHGMAASSVEGLSVVTGVGEPVDASRDENPIILDAMLGGMGMFGFITGVTLRLRPMKPRTRTFFLLYDDLKVLLADQRRLMNKTWCAHLEGFASSSLQGNRLEPNGQRVPFIRWFYGLHVSVESEAGAEPDQSILGDLGFRELLHIEDADTVERATRADGRFKMMVATGAWEQAHPWLECMLPYAAAVEILPRLISRMPLFLGDGHRILLIADVPRPKLLIHPAGAPVVGFTVLPAGIAPGQLEPALRVLRAIHDEIVDVGGKRYLSGWLFEPDEGAWRRHYGDSHQLWRQTKSGLDPSGILGSVLHPAR